MVLQPVRNALACATLLLLATAALSAKCSTSADCVSPSPCTIDICEPIRRICVSIGPATCVAAPLVETTLAALLRAAEAKPLNVAERLTIIAEAERTFRDLHVHRLLHRNFIGVDPAALLRAFAKEVGAPGYKGSVVDFHQRMISIFEKANDLHTVYVPPPPLGSAAAFLPFQVREYYEPTKGHGPPPSVRVPKYIVSDVAAKAKLPHPTFQKGVRILSWNGIPISEAVFRQGEAGYASNEDAKHSLGLKGLTIRALNIDLLPETDAVKVEFMSLNGTRAVMHIDWRFAVDAEDASSLAPVTSVRTPAMHAEFMRHASARQLKRLSRPARVVDTTTVREIPVRANFTDSFDARIVYVGGGSFGVITVHNFLTLDEEAFQSEMLRVVLQMPSSGLVFDLRGNDGGLPPLCQEIVQLFTKKRVQVTSSAVRSTKLTLRLARTPIQFELMTKYLREIFGAPSRTADAAELFQDQYFGRYRIEEQEANVYTGPRYEGPVIVLVDAETYSAGDIFAAVVQDSGAATLVGVDGSTGGGGSAVSNSAFLPLFYPNEFKALPGNVSWPYSQFRLTRGGKNEGSPIEFFGVKPDLRYYYTRGDRLNGDADLKVYLNNLLKQIRRQPVSTGVPTPTEIPLQSPEVSPSLVV